MFAKAEARGDMTAWILAVVLTVAYALFAHYASAVSDVGVWALVLAGAPMLFAIGGLMRESRWGFVLLALTVAALALLVWLWPSLHNPVSWLYFAQNFGINAALAVLFGRTLIGGRRPLVTAMASIVHERMTPVLERYTRQVTLTWTLFFLASALLSALLFFFASIETWSIYANILSFPLVGLLFLVEYLVRRRVLPAEDLVDLPTTVRAFRAKFKSS